MTHQTLEERWKGLYCDSAQVVGQAHARVAQVSQDCVLHGVAQHAAWAVVSDGCSSGGRTDIGARLWALAIERDLSDPESRLLQVFGKGSTLGPTLAALAPPDLPGVAWEDRLATVGAVCFTQHAAWGALAGDGYLMAIYADGSLDIVEHRFNCNRPFYPEFLRHDAAVTNFIAASKEQGQGMHVERTKLNSRGDTIEQSTLPIPIDASLEFTGSSYFFPLRSPTEARAPLAGLLALTDGAGSRPSVLPFTTLRALSNFQQQGSRQAVRRHLAALLKDWTAEQTLPKDDLSITAISIMVL